MANVTDLIRCAAASVILGLAGCVSGPNAMLVGVYAPVKPSSLIYYYELELANEGRFVLAKIFEAMNQEVADAGVRVNRLSGTWRVEGNEIMLIPVEETLALPLHGFSFEPFKAVIDGEPRGEIILRMDSGSIWARLRDESPTRRAALPERPAKKGWWP